MKDLDIFDVLTSITIQNTLYVAKNGDDSKGKRNRLDKPFLTCNGAKNAAQSGDTIYVFAGTYDEKNLLKNGGNWIFDNGAIVEFTGSANGAIFDDSVTNGAGEAVTSRISGKGRFRRSSSGTNPNVLNLVNASNITLFALELLGGGSEPTIRTNNAGVTCQIECLNIVTGIALNVLNCKEIVLLRTQINGSNNGEIIKLSNGKLNITNCRIKNTNVGALATVIDKSGGTLSLEDVVLVSLGGGTGGNIITAPTPQNVIIYSGAVNQGVSPNITQKVSSLIVDPEVTF